MTDTPTAQPKTDFHPQIEELFDEAQKGPVVVDLGDKETAVLSEAGFARVQHAADTLKVAVKHVRVDRGSKPAVVLVPVKEVKELLGLIDLALETSDA